MPTWPNFGHNPDLVGFCRPPQFRKSHIQGEGEAPTAKIPFRDVIRMRATWAFAIDPG
jgi:hypothetical protein